MKISIKNRAVALLAILAISSIALHSRAACNSPYGKKGALLFSKSDDNAYGYDDMNTEGISNDDHISVKKGSDTYVQMHWDKESDGEPDQLSFASRLLEFTDSGGIVSIGQIPNTIPADGCDLKISGVTKGEYVLQVSRENYTGVCGEITIHVYEEKTISEWHMYLDKSLSATAVDRFNEKKFLELANDLAKPAVMSFSDVEIHEDGIDVLPIYDKNSNNALDIYRAQTDLGREMIAIKGAIANLNLEGAPVSIVAGGSSQFGWVLRDDADVGDDFVTVNRSSAGDVVNSISEGDEITIGCSGNEETKKINEILFRSGYVIIKLINNGNYSATLNNDHDTSYDDGVYIKGAFNYGDVQYLGSDTSDAVIVHEAFHSDTCGGLMHITQDDDTNIMAPTVSFNPTGLRYCPMSSDAASGKESQWEKVQGQ